MQIQTCFKNNNSNAIKSFCDEWIRKFSDENICSNQLADDMNFPERCRSFGWNVDNGESFKKQYPCNSYDETLAYLPKVTEVNILGNLIFSRWRYYNHWAYPPEDITDSREWFISALTRLKEIADLN